LIVKFDYDLLDGVASSTGQLVDWLAGLGLTDAALSGNQPR
jgi:hypothetical protein